MFVFPTKLIPKSDTAHSGLKAGLSLFYRPFAIFVLPSSYNQYNCSYLVEEEKQGQKLVLSDALAVQSQGYQGPKVSSPKVEISKNVL